VDEIVWRGRPALKNGGHVAKTRHRRESGSPFFDSFIHGAETKPGPHPQYSLPPSLQGKITQSDYCNWLENKSKGLYKRDLARNKPYACSGSIQFYKQKISEAVCENCLTDPFTGEEIRWDLVSAYDPTRIIPEKDYLRQFYLMPSVDHSDPESDTLTFEICTFIINLCKTDQSPSEFVALCSRIISYRSRSHPASLSPGVINTLPSPYIPPPFLQGLCTPATYRKWIDEKAEALFVRDRKLQRAYALNSSKAVYKNTIHRAVLSNGACDPYIGAVMDWRLICTWNDSKAKQDNQNFKKTFSLLPTVDHTDPNASDLDFEICSWLVNDCKSCLNAQEFLDLCARVARFGGMTKG
jgi:hypothetical protein